MSFISKGFSAVGRLIALGVLACAFLLGMSGVVYMSLQGSEVKVPEVLGKDLPESEKELASLGLKIKKRAERASDEQPGTVIEQLPKPGETVKTGQMILVVTSKGPGQNGEHPASIKTNEEDDTEKIEEMISDDKPKKKSNSNANANRKKADTTRDVNAASNSNAGSNISVTNSNKKEPTSTNSSDKPKANTAPATIKPGGEKPKPEKKP